MKVASEEVLPCKEVINHSNRQDACLNLQVLLQYQMAARHYTQCYVFLRLNPVSRCSSELRFPVRYSIIYYWASNGLVGDDQGFLILPLGTSSYPLRILFLISGLVSVYFVVSSKGHVCIHECLVS